MLIKVYNSVGGAAFFRRLLREWQAGGAQVVQHQAISGVTCDTEELPTAETHTTTSTEQELGLLRMEARVSSAEGAAPEFEMSPTSSMARQL